MSDLGSILTSLFGSGAVSVLVVLLLRTWLEARVRRSLEAELETLRHENEKERERLREELKVAHEFLERRIALYPRIVELVYRIRNLAREAVSSQSMSMADLEDLPQQVRELENSLFEQRFFLQHDGLFDEIHAFKNEAITFVQLFQDLESADLVLSKGTFSLLQRQLQDRYASIEKLHKPIIERFSSLVPELG